MKNKTTEKKVKKYTVRANRFDNLYVYGGVGNKRLTVGWIGESFVRDTIKLLLADGHTEFMIIGKETGIWYPIDSHGAFAALLKKSISSKFIILAR